MGPRSNMLLNPNAQFDLAVRIQTVGAPLGEVFSFLSGLYFRGKLAYANEFATVRKNLRGVWIITTNQGLLPPETLITGADLQAFGDVDINPKDTRYVQSLQQSALALATQLPARAEVVLLGSIGTQKYAELLLKIFGEQLKFPAEFVGRGDMSRGGLLLRCVDSGKELEYFALAGAVRHGKRPPKLGPRFPNGNA
jgi:hypothetical protein